MCVGRNAAADPRTNGWFTTFSGQYARIYTNDAMQSAGSSLTAWSNGSQTQAAPAYCGVQDVYSSANWIYVRSTGLASYTMGPWQHGNFPNLPVNQKNLFRFPRTVTVPVTNSSTGLGQIGIFVDGVEMFNSCDAFYWNGSSDVSGAGSGYWNRDAYVNEGATFDPGYAHQQNTGTYHYHANPIGLRYLLGDHVTYDAAAKTFSESTTAPTQHSPLLGWVSDGCPIYGPYGYSNATNPASGIRRMISGYVIRNGQYGTSNLTANGRTTIPAWAVRLGAPSANQAGPAVSSSYPLGRYMEDNDYLGDHGFVQGVDFDLDEFNGRWCVTPEFPTGIYAYFVAIASNGVPVYPYNIGRGYYGSPTGSAVSSIGETVVTNFAGGPSAAPVMQTPHYGNGLVTLTWSAVEGGSYELDASTNLTNWSALRTNIAATQIAASNYDSAPDLAAKYYRARRIALAAYDGDGSGPLAVAPGGNAARSSSVTVSITLPSSPPWPPANAPISSVTLAGTITGSSISYATQGTVVATFNIPANAPTGSQNIVVTFGSPGPPPYTVTFTID